MFTNILEERRLLDAKTILIDEVDYIVNDRLIINAKE